MSRAVELLAWSDCPSHPAAERQLRAILDGLGLQDVRIELTWIEDDETATRRRFVGSPTLRVDDEELIPVGPAAHYGLTCRVYRLGDGRFSPTPDTEELRRAVVAHFGGGAG